MSLMAKVDASFQKLTNSGLPPRAEQNRMVLHRMIPLRIEAPACEMGGYIGGLRIACNRQVAPQEIGYKPLILL